MSNPLSSSSLISVLSESITLHTHTHTHVISCDPHVIPMCTIILQLKKAAHKQFKDMELGWDQLDAMKRGEGKPMADKDVQKVISDLI